MDVSTSEPADPVDIHLNPDIDTPGFRRGLERFLDNQASLVTGSVHQLDPLAPQSPPVRLQVLPGATSARRQWEAAGMAATQGVPVLRVLAAVGYNADASLLITERVPGACTFREALIHHYYERPFCEELMTLLQVCADGVRAMHEQGWRHRNLTLDQVLVSRKEKGPWEQAWILGLQDIPTDPGTACSPEARGRDNALIDLPSDFLRIFLEMQWAPATVPPECLKAEKHARKEAAAPAALPTSGRVLPEEKEIWIWDHRSKQAIPALKSRDKRKYYRKRDAGAQLASWLKWSPRMRKETRACMQAAWAGAVDLDRRIGISINLEADRFEQELNWLTPLGPMPLLVRLYHHESEANRRYALEAVRRLHAEGHTVSVALVQDRRAVTQPAAWRRFVDWAAGGLSGFAESLEVGHAINRVKWGFWNIPEYREFVQAFDHWHDRYPQLPLMGPAGIDFEFLRVLPMLNQWSAGSLSAFSHHLYVDRRGAPENTQAGYDLLRKLAVARAISRVHPACEERVVVSEVNWPLAGTGVWSPVGSPYQSPGERTGDPSVDEKTYADFMKRYLLLALCSGLADRVYWWNLVAHGFGLVDDRDPNGWRPRPGYHVFKDLVETFRKSRFERRTRCPEGWAYTFSRKDETLTMTTTLDGADSA
jgi:hypothetical protein